MPENAAVNSTAVATTPVPRKLMYGRSPIVDTSDPNPNANASR
jgi:hypothetical protein